MNMYEWTPTPPKVRVTKKQLKQIQKNMQNASKIAKRMQILEQVEEENPEEILKKLDELE